MPALRHLIAVGLEVWGPSENAIEISDHLRKRTMLITTARWMKNLNCPAMTPERRQDYINLNKIVSHVSFESLLVNLFPNDW